MRCGFKIILCLLCWIGAPLSAAASMPVISYYVVSQDVRSVMNDMGKILGIPISAAPDIKGKATSGRYNGTAVEVLDALCRDMGLHRFYDGNTLYVTRASSAVTRVLDMNAVSRDELSDGLRRIGIDTEQFPLREDREKGVLVLYGPPRYAAVVETVADHLISAKRRSLPGVMRGR